MWKIIAIVMSFNPESPYTSEVLAVDHPAFDSQHACEVRVANTEVHVTKDRAVFFMCEET